MNPRTFCIIFWRVSDISEDLANKIYRWNTKRITESWPQIFSVFPPIGPLPPLAPLPSKSNFLQFDQSDVLLKSQAPETDSLRLDDFLFSSRAKNVQQRFNYSLKKQIVATILCQTENKYKHAETQQADV